MPLIWILAVVAALAAGGYVAGRHRAMASAGGDPRVLHSLPRYYGLNVALTAIVPALAVLLAWMMIQPLVVEAVTASAIPDGAIPKDSTRGLVLSDVHRLADAMATRVDPAVLADIDPQAPGAAERLADAGVLVGSDTDPSLIAAAKRSVSLSRTGHLAMTVIAILAAAAGLAVAYRMTDRDFRARNTVERGTMALLMGAALIAIATTAGIVLSMLFESIDFFSRYPAADFFFGTTWSPSFSGRGGASQLGILPLLWGTLYISFIALAVAVPIGLFAAIYLSEYATPRVRAIAKPLIEVLAGIPTIVYGLFALITVGPLLRDYFAQPLRLGDSGSSVMTAGLVMGVMLIPFVSSLSDDIINAVPQSMRDGSLGLGATRSETIRQVIVPAALPGIVGAVLLAASRAIGETMIVVLGAGAAAQMSLNPFEAMTTVTVKIVSQLTGDTDFNSPETLVAFALGLTLFVITLGLNVLALWIVRRYREQYE